MNQIIEYIKQQKYVEVSELYNLFKIDHQHLKMIINNFNQHSFYYQIVWKEDNLYWELKNDQHYPNSRYNRLKNLQDLWLININTIDQLELLFARSRKTLYKDIQKIKQNLKTEFANYNYEQQYYYQQIINQVDHQTVKRLLNLGYTEVEIIKNITMQLDQLFNLNLTVQVIKLRTPKNVGDERIINSLTNDLITNMEYYQKKKIVRMKIESKLKQHLLTSYWRYQTMTFDRLINVEEMVIAQTNDYQQIRMIIKMVFKSRNLFWNDQEIFLIALYFLDLDIYEKYQIGLNCQQTSEELMLINELEYYFKDFLIVSENPDLLLTINEQQGIHFNVKHQREVKVKLPFDVYDLKNIAGFLKLNRQENDVINLYLKLKPLLRKSVDFEKFKATISYKVPQNPEHFDEYLSLETITIVDHVCSWQQAIYDGSLPLQQQFKIDQQYPQYIVELLNKYQGEMTIAPGVLLAHAPNLDVVYQTGFSLFFSREPIVFPGQNMVQLIILFCGKTETELILPLQDLYIIINAVDVIKELEAVTEANEVINFFRNCRNKQKYQ